MLCVTYTSWPCGLGQASHSAQRVPNFQKGIMKTLQAAKDPLKAYVGGLCRTAHEMCRYWDVATVRGTRKPAGHASQPAYQRGGPPTNEHRSDHLECDGHAGLAMGPCPDACPRPRSRPPMAGRDGAGLQASLFLPGTREGDCDVSVQSGGICWHPSFFPWCQVRTPGWGPRQELIDYECVSVLNTFLTFCILDALASGALLMTCPGGTAPSEGWVILRKNISLTQEHAFNM